jgi:hypothetical protein
VELQAVERGLPLGHSPVAEALPFTPTEFASAGGLLDTKNLRRVLEKGRSLQPVSAGSAL